MNFRLLVMAAAGALLLAAPSPAAAMSGRCLWDSRPDARRAELVEEFRQKGLKSDEPLRQEDSAGFAACGAAGSGEAQGRLTLAAYLLMHASSVVLGERHAIDEATLDGRWKALSPADREALTFSVGSLVTGEGDAVTGAPALERFVASFQARPESEEALASYAMGRAMLELLEALPDPQAPDQRTA